MDSRDTERRRIPVGGAPAGGSGGPGGGGGGGKKDILDEPHLKEHIKHWEKLGYSKEQMRAEAPYVRRAPRQVPTA